MHRPCWNRVFVFSSRRGCNPGLWVRFRCTHANGSVLNVCMQFTSNGSVLSDKSRKLPGTEDSATRRSQDSGGTGCDARPLTGTSTQRLGSGAPWHPLPRRLRVVTAWQRWCSSAALVLPQAAATASATSRRPAPCRPERARRQRPRSGAYLRLNPHLTSSLARALPGQPCQPNASTAVTVRACAPQSQVARTVAGCSPAWGALGVNGGIVCWGLTVTVSHAQAGVNGLVKRRLLHGFEDTNHKRRRRGQFGSHHKVLRPDAFRLHGPGELRHLCQRWQF